MLDIKVRGTKVMLNKDDDIVTTFTELLAAIHTVWSSIKEENADAAEAFYWALKQVINDEKVWRTPTVFLETDTPYGDMLGVMK